MRILIVCAEFAPLAKVGGLADVTAGLSAYLARQGHQVVVVMPHYGVSGSGVLPPGARPVLGPRPIVTAGEGSSFSIYRAEEQAAGTEVFLVDCPEHFGGAIYSSGAPEARRFMLLSRAALALAPAIGFAPDILHCHDWHAAPAVVLLNASS